MVNPEKYGIEPSKANELMGGLPQIKEEREFLVAQYNTIMSLDIDLPETQSMARELRLRIRDNRTKGIEVWHKKTKDFFLNGGRFVDSIKNMEVEVNQRMEENLESIEKHAEIQRKQKQAELALKRTLEAGDMMNYIPSSINLGTIDDSEWLKLLGLAKLQHEQKIAEEAKAEADRLASEKINQLAKSRKEILIDLWAFVPYDNKLENMGLWSDEEFNYILQFAKDSKEDHDVAMENQRKENERLRVEAEERERTIAEERRLAKEANDKLEAIAKAKAAEDAKVEAERKRIASEEAKAAKAPIKTKMSVWVNSFALPDCPVENELSSEIIQKFESFKNWSLNQISNA
jgi:hypothetical protein